MHSSSYTGLLIYDAFMILGHRLLPTGPDANANIVFQHFYANVLLQVANPSNKLSDSEAVRRASWDAAEIRAHLIALRNSDYKSEK